MDYKYPPVGFHFKVVFTGKSSEADSYFQSVSGLSVDIETEEITEGGENRFKHKLPNRTKYANLVLKRGIIKDSQVVAWLRDTFENNVFKPLDLVITLLGENKEPLITWNVEHAYPIKWSVSDFNAEESKLVIESIDLAYNYFNRV